MKYFLSSLVLFLTIGLMSSCSKTDDSVTPIYRQQQVGDADESYSFHKDIKLVSESGILATMRVSSDSKALLDEYSDANFKLTELKSGENLFDALVRDKVIDPLQKANLDEPIDNDVNMDNQEKSDLAFELIGGVKDSKLAVTFFHPQSVQSRGWHYYTHYSAAGQGLEQTFEIVRTSWWRRVYFGLKYKAHSWNGWGTIVSEWRKLHYNETYTKDKNPCYQFRARVKTKRNGAYSVSFDY